MPAMHSRQMGVAALAACFTLGQASILASVHHRTRVVTDTSRLEHQIRELSVLGSESRIQSVKENMTLDESFKSLPPLPATLTSFLADKFAGHRSVQLIKTESTVKHLRAKKSNKTKSVEEAREMLNDFIEETVQRLDTEKIRCGSDLHNQMVLIEQASQDLADYSAQASDADADISRAEANMEELRVTRESLEEELEEHNRICSERIKYFKDEIAVMEADAEIMAGIVNMTTCDEEAMFVQCSSKSGSSIRFAAPTIQQKVSQIKSNRTFHRLQSAMEQLYKMGDIHAMKGALTQVGTQHDRKTKKHLRKAKKHDQEPSDDLMAAEPEEEESCTLASNPNCGKLLDKFMELSGAVESDLEKYQKDLEEEEERCKSTKESMEAQISDLESRSMSWETSLAEATSRETHAQQMMTEKEVEKSDLTTEFNDMSGECKTNIETCESEMCALGKIRGELYKMSSTPPYIVDCQVSDWSAEECSVPCGGGIHNYTRAVTVPAELGAACPPLVLEQQCNVQECPIDCSISEWSGWSACSAKCGGGVRERMRTISEHARFGGDPCGQASQTEPCNLQACDVDCVLGPWTKEYETKCSKACDGGVKQLRRGVDVPAIGMGECPAEDSPERLEEVACNEFACDPTQGDTLKCKSKVDIILLLDGSGSLGQTGWEQTVGVAKELIRSFNAEAGNENGTKVATLLFSGPQYWDDYYRCLGQRLLPGEIVNMETECGMQWVEHLTDDTSGMEAKLDALVWPQMTTFTSEALLMAEAELTYGRADASKVVIIITDGIPLNEYHTTDAAASMKSKARLVWVPVGGNVPMEHVALWASKPVTDNVVPVAEFEDMTSADTVNKIIADTCSEVV